MIGSRVLSGNRKALAPILFGVVAFGMFAQAGLAEDRVFVTPDGRRIPLAESDSEFVVTFDRLESVERSVKQLAAKGIGVAEELPGAPTARHRIVRVAETSAKRRSKMLLDPSIVAVRPVYRMPGSSSPLMSSGAIAMKLRPAVTDAEFDDLLTDYRIEVIKQIDGLTDVYTVKPLDDAEDEVLRAQVLADDERTLWAQPDFRYRPRTRQLQPTDQYFDRQWHLENTGQDGGTAGADISALEAWGHAQGLDVLFGMFDDACDINHPDLFEAYTGTGQDPKNEVTDYDAPGVANFGEKHGTAVMGLAAARFNEVGGLGVAFFSRFTVSRGLNDQLTASQIAGVYTFARQQDVDVHINSWGFDGDAPPAIVVDAVATAFEQGRDPDGEEGDDAPLGMVLVFASGNGLGDEDDVGIELTAGDDLSTLPTVIGVGATNNQDFVAAYSNFGPEIDLLAPGGDELAALITTDNDDANVFVDDGYNIGGLTFSGEADLDADGQYTKTFAGTSAACPIVAGVAGLMISANRLLTATDVRIILEHTADRINPAGADYNNVSGRSLRYGYGRVNAATSVTASIDALPSALGQNWPAKAEDVVLDDTEMTWRAGRGTREFLVIESPGGLTFDNDEADRFPKDGDCYSTEQFGCGDVDEDALAEIPDGVAITHVEACDGDCSTSTDFTLADLTADGVSYAVYGRSSIGRYAWGTESTLADAGTEDGGGTITVTGPKINIQASPIEGVSPLVVTFNANATRTTADIDDTRTTWDFDIDDDITRDATTRHAVHTYEVPANTTRTFIARITMYDVESNPSLAQVTIRVEGASDSTTIDSEGQSDVRLLVGIPGSADSDVDQGQSPFDVLLSVDATSLGGSLQSVEWDLGDGTTANSLVVPHTFVNETDGSLRIPVVAAITIRTSPVTTQTLTATRVITVTPGPGAAQQFDPTLEGTQTISGGSASTCGVLGMLPLAFMFSSLLWMRRRGD